MEGRQDQRREGRGEDQRREGEEKGTLHVEGNSETLCSPPLQSSHVIAPATAPSFASISSLVPDNSLCRGLMDSHLHLH